MGAGEAGESIQQLAACLAVESVACGEKALAGGVFKTPDVGDKVGTADKSVIQCAGEAVLGEFLEDVHDIPAAKQLHRVTKAALLCFLRKAAGADDEVLHSLPHVFRGASFIQCEGLHAWVNPFGGDGSMSECRILGHLGQGGTGVGSGSFGGGG